MWSDVVLCAPMWFHIVRCGPMLSDVVISQTPWQLLLPGMQSVEPIATFCVRSAKAKVESERSSPRRLWQSIDTLKGRGRVPLSTTVDANDLHRCFDDKIAGVRASTADTPPPYFVPAPSDCSLSAFSVPQTDDIVAIIRKLPNKQCATDPIPVSYTHLTLPTILRV